MSAGREIRSWKDDKGHGSHLESKQLIEDTREEGTRSWDTRGRGLPVSLQEGDGGKSGRGGRERSRDQILEATPCKWARKSPKEVKRESCMVSAAWTVHWTGWAGARERDTGELGQQSMPKGRRSDPTPMQGYFSTTPLVLSACSEQFIMFQEPSYT